MTTVEAAPRSTGFAGALRCVPYRRLLTAHGVATVGQVMLVLAAGVHVLARTGSGPWVSLTVSLAFLPYAVLSTLAGVLADRTSRSGLLSACCLLRAAGGCVLTAALLGQWPVPVVVVLTAAVAAVATPSYPALAAATPQCLPGPALPAANALTTGVENAAWIGAPGAFGLLALCGLGPAAVVAVSSAAFLAAGVVAGPARLPAPARPAPSGWAADLREGLLLVAGTAAVRRPMALAVLDNFLYGYLVVALVLLADATGGPDVLGALNGGLAAGALLAMLWVTRLVAGPWLPVLPVAMLLGFGGCVAVLGVTGPGPAGVVAVAVAGATTLVAEVSAVTLMQRAADGPALARVFGVYDQLNVGAVALGSALAGPVAAWGGPGRGLLAGAAATCVLALPGLVPHAEHAAAARRQPA